MQTTEMTATQPTATEMDPLEAMTGDAPMVIIDPAPGPTHIDMPAAAALAAPPEITDPFVYSDIKAIVRVPAGFQCQVKFDHRDDYLSFLACADDIEPHGRAIYKACLSRSDVTDYVPTDADFLSAAQERIALELRRANAEVTKYQDRLDIDDATDSDKALLMAWKTYRVALHRLDTQPGWPASLRWPLAPTHE